MISLVSFTNCNAPVSELTDTTQPMSTSSDSIESTEKQDVSPTLSLLATWEMRSAFATDWHPTRDVVAISGSDINGNRGAQIYDIQTGEKIWFRESGWAYALAFLSEGNSIAMTPFYEAHVQILDTERENVVSNMTSDDCSAGQWLQFNPGENKLLTGLGRGHQADWETTINMWDMQTGSCNQLDKRFGLLTFLDVSDDFNYVAMSIYFEDHQVYIRDLETGNDICNLSGDFSLFVPSTDQFVVVNAEKLSFYETDLCQPVRDLIIDPPHDGYFAFSPNGGIFATSGDYLQLWDTNTGKLLFQVKQPEKLFGSRSHPRLFFNPNGDYLLAVYATLDNNDEQIAVIQVWKLLINP
jgi:WD40 repeat protein